MLQPNVRCEFCENTFFVSESIKKTEPITCQKCGSVFAKGDLKIAN